MSATTTASKSTTHAFQAEVSQVLNLMINSLYSNKEIFLRELIANASDACDKLRFEALTNESLLEDDQELAITLEIDEDAGVLRIIDNGIGMTEEEVISNIGTIARSGTRKFIESMTGDSRKDSQLIGQFGVGFYSAFIVADKVVLTTRKAGNNDPAVRWESDGKGEFAIETLDEHPRGTVVELHLGKDESEFLKSYRIRSIVSKYSDFIAFPIRMLADPAPAEEGEEPAAPEMTVINQATALWARPKGELSDEDYQAFYKQVSNDFNDAASWSHNRVEGNQAYTTLLYLPSKAPFDMMMNREERHGLKLYIKRMFIMDAAESLLPNYLRFVRGVVDSDDLPLNVSREILQDNPLLGKIRSAVTKRVLGMIEKLSDDREAFTTFWKEFGSVLKEGLVEDFAQRETLLKLIRVQSTHTRSNDEPWTTLADYVSRMKPNQDKIYYLTADSMQAALHSPHMGIFDKNDIEVLLLTDRVDEWMMGHVTDFDGKPFQSIAKGDLDLDHLIDEDSRKEHEEQSKASESLIERLKSVLEDKVEEVRVSSRLTDSPACIVISEHEMAMHLQAMLKQAGHEMPGSKPTLEINPQHALIKLIDGQTDDDSFAEWAQLIFDQAWLSEGGQLEDPAGFVRRQNERMLSIGQ